MYGSIGASLLLSFLSPPFRTSPLPLVGFYAEISRRARLSNIAGRRFLRRVTYIPRCVEERERERGRAAMTTTGTKYITCFPLKKQI